MVLAIQKQQTKLLNKLMRHGHATIIDHTLPIIQKRSANQLILLGAQSHSPGHQQSRRCRFA